MATIKIKNAGKDVEKREPLRTVGRNVKPASVKPVWKTVWRFQKN